MTTLTEAQERALLGRFPATDVPAVLLPVRVETRFITTGPRPELLVRVYPDEVHVDEHEPELTDDEVAWGRAFWEQTWRAGVGAPAATTRRGVWDRLVQRFGAERAAWIAAELAPTNPGERSAEPVPDGTTLPRSPRFPAHAEKEAAWTRPARARLLPERWIVIGRRGEARVALASGSPVQPDLAVGPDPAAAAPSSPRDDVLTVDPGLRWLVEFGAAEAAGMALRVPLTADDVRLGFDTLLVVGLRTSPEPAAEAAALERLVAAHRSTHGMATVRAGTATNNSDDGAVPSPAVGVTSPAEHGAPLAADAAGSLLAVALGIDAAALAPLAGSDVRADAAAMLTLLWPVTGGYFLEQLFAAGTDAAAARRHAIDHVRPDGPLPAVRVGRQPYGILPVTSLDRWPTGPPTDIPITWLRRLRERWRPLVPRVPRLDRRPTTTRPPSESEVLAVLRAGPSSSGYAARILHDHGIFGHAQLHGRVELPLQAAQHAGTLQTLLTALGVAGRPRLLATVLGAAAGELRDRLVAAADAPVSDADLFAWLRGSAPLQIRDEVGIEPRPDHLLYLLARHAVLLTYAGVAAEIQRAAGDTSPAIDPAVVDVTEVRTSTLGRRLEGPFPSGFPALELLSAADHPAGGRLDELRVALDHLSTLPPQRLAVLLTGTLDLFAYRLDAWLTSLATRRLAELRARKPRGAVVGGYGWLVDVRPRPAATAAPATADEPAPLTVDPSSAGFVHAPSLNQATTAALLRSGYVGATPTTGAPATNAFAVDLSSRRVRLADWILEGVRAGQELAALLGQRFERGLHSRGLDAHLPAFRRVAPFGDVAIAQAAADDARDTVARLRAELQERLTRGRLAVAAADKQVAALVKERDAIPGQLAITNAKLSPLVAERSEKMTERTRIQNLLAKRPNDELLNDRLLEVSADLKGLDFQIKPLQEQVARLTKRKGELTPLIATAEEDLEDAQQVVDDLTGKPYPGLAAAEAAEKRTASELAAVLEAHRKSRLFPPASKIEVMEATAATSLVDGLGLARLHEQRRVPFGKKGLPPTNHSHHAPLVAELDELVAVLDAVADALTAESVHQLVLGNPERAGASLDAVARRQAPPPELEFARTPRSGATVTHRVAVVAAASGRVPAGWPAGDGQVRAAAEPVLHAWIGGLLGDPRRIRADVTFVDTDGAVVGEDVLRFDALELGPLDVVAMVAEDATPRPELSDLLQEAAAARRPSGVPADASALVRFERRDGWDDDERSLTEVFEVARAASALVHGARPLAPADLAQAGEVGIAAVDSVELVRRADGVVAAARLAHERLDTTAAEDIERVVRPFGIASAGAAEELTRRLDAVAALGPAPDDDDALVEHATARIQAVLGSSFVALPRLSAAADVARAVADNDARFGGDPSAPAAWLAEVATVRAGVERLETVVLYAAADGQTGQLAVAQLPFTAGERWVALPAAPGQDVPSGRTSLVILGPPSLDVVAPFAGLVVDEWTEVVPGAREVTGVACNIDEPAAQPPQTILVAVAPPTEPRWGVDLLEAILLETLDAARLRAVTPEQLSSHSDLEQILPAIYVGFNLQNHTVSTDFTRAMGA